MPNKYFDLMQPNIDSFGVIAQGPGDNRDGGDTTQREGMFMCAMQYHLKAGRIAQADFDQMAARYKGIIDNLTYGFGWSLRRHPDKNKWYYESNCMSRDQMTPNLVALGFCHKMLLFKMLICNAARGMLFTTNTRQNGAYPKDQPTMSLWQRIKFAVGLYDPGISCYYWKLPDFTDFSIWGLYIRGLNLFPLWPLLVLLDIEMALSATFTWYNTKKGTASNDQLTEQMILLQANYRLPTPVSKLAMWIYKKTNPMNSLNAYFAPAGNGPALNQVYQEIWSDQ